MDYETLMKKYIEHQVPLDKINKKLKLEIQELEAIKGEEDNSLKQLNIYRLFYAILTFFLIIILILSVNFKLK